MTAEGIIAIAAGISAGSIALIGFGIDSAIEGMASVIIIWRWGRRALSETAELALRSSSPCSSSSWRPTWRLKLFEPL